MPMSGTVAESTPLQEYQRNDFFLMFCPSWEISESFIGASF